MLIANALINDVITPSNAGSIKAKGEYYFLSSTFSSLISFS